MHCCSEYLTDHRPSHAHTNPATPFGFCVLHRVAKKPHPKVLGALAMDDSRPTMPIALPKAECDLMAVMDNDVYTLGDRLRLVCHR